MPQSKAKKTKKESKKADSKKSAENPKQAKSPGKLAVVLIRGTVNLSPDVKKTLNELKLKRKNSCVVLDDNPVSRGMLRKVNEAVTWGKVTTDTAKKIKGVTGLHPPRGGFERKGIKMPYSRGGALGKRDNMDELLGRMK